MIDYTPKERKAEERMAWIFFALMALVLGFALGRKLGQDPPPPPMAEAALVERLTTLEARAEAEAKRRCLAVTTDKLEFTVYQTPNLGTEPKIKRKP